MANKNSAANQIESSENVLLARLDGIAMLLSMLRETIEEMRVITESERFEINLEPIIEKLETIRVDINAFSKQKSDHIRSVVGTIEIAEADPDLLGADEYIRKAFFKSLYRPVIQKKTKRVMKHKTEKDRKVG
jgi:hypothetical protein